MGPICQGQIIFRLLDLISIADQSFIARVTFSVEDGEETWVESPCWFDDPWICFDVEDSRYCASHEDIGHLHTESFQSAQQQTLWIDLQSRKIKRVEILPV